MEKYNKELNYSYSFGTFPTYELVNNMPQNCIKIVFHSALKDSSDILKLKELLSKNNIPFEYNDKFINKVRDKDSILTVGIFKKYTQSLDPNKNHLVLHNPSDFGNVGTIVRTALGFGFNNIALIKPCADIFNPKTIRASMGSVFSSNIELFDSFEDYLKKNNQNRTFYPFMLKAKTTLQELSVESLQEQKISLIFGNESSGLDDKFLELGTPIKINHSNKIDSLNLCNSVSIAIYEFDKLLQRR